MAEVVNLRTARKRQQRRQHSLAAAANRLAAGRSKAARALEKARNDKSRRNLDHHRIETGAER